jgi:SNF2 family DNA or RNA helicase
MLEGEPHPVSTTALFALLTRLKQICNFDPASCQSSKLDAIATVIESLVGVDDKMLIFSQYVRTLEWLAPRLGQVAHEIYHGGLSPEERDQVLSRFEGSPGPRILLMSLRAGGLGLNLQSASIVVLFDRWWNPAVEVQAIYRAHRFDRTRPLHVLRLLVHDSIEERINEILTAKEELFEEYVEQAPVSDTRLLTRGDLLRILELTPSETGPAESRQEDTYGTG